jgi:hypothetical protein
MAKTYTIPELLRMAAVRGYTPRLESAINNLLNSSSESDYQVALRDATEEVTYLNTNEGYSDKSHFPGLSIYMPLVFESYDGVADDFLLESAIINITRQRKIVTTELQGRDGDVVEFISNGSYEISVTGLICTPGTGYPKKLVTQFEAYCLAKRSIKIIHDVLNSLGVFEIVIKDYSLPSTPFINGQQYSFNAMADQPIELIIE